MASAGWSVTSPHSSSPIVQRFPQYFGLCWLDASFLHQQKLENLMILLLLLEPISTKHLGLCKWFSSMTGVDWLADSSSSCWRLWRFPVILKVFLCLSHALMHSWYRSNYSDAPKCVPHYPTRWFCGIIMKAAASVGSQEVFDFLPTSHIWEAYLPPGDASLRRESQVPRREKSVNVWWHSGHSSDWGW